MVYEYTTPTLVQAELNSSTSFSGSTFPSFTTVAKWIQEESAYINQIAERIFSTDQVTITRDYNGEEYIMLEESPIVSIDSFEYNSYPIGGSGYASGWTTKTEDTHFTLYEDKALIAILFGNFTPTPGRKKLRIQYTYGYATTPTIIEKLATKLVAERVLSAVLNANLETGNDGGTVSVGSISIVEPANYGVANYQRLKTDIERLKDEVIGSFKVFRLQY